MSSINIVNILDLINEMGEDYVNACLSHFACKNNEEIDYFLKKNAIEFSKRGLSITYLIFLSSEGVNNLVGYFSLAYKVLQVYQDKISTTTEKKIKPFAEYDSSLHIYTIPAPLIAQFGKNSNLPKPLYDELSGKDMLNLVLDQIQRIQHMVGGRFVFLECEDNPFLLSFYESQGFRPIAKRYTDEASGVEFYHQLLKQHRPA